MYSIKYLFWRWCGAPGFFTPVISCAPRATKKTLRVEALAPFFLTCWSREIQCYGLCHYGPQKIWPSKSMGLRKYGPKKLWPSKKEWSLGLRTMLLWSRMMPALFWPSKSQLSFHHPPFPEGMIPRSLQYGFCYSTPTASPTPIYSLSITTASSLPKTFSLHSSTILSVVIMFC